MNAYEDFALGLYLSCWPENKSYEYILELILNENENCKEDDLYELSIWEPFEDVDREWLVEQIENLKESVQEKFIVKEC